MLILNMANRPILPRNYREYPAIRISGSSAPSYDSLKTIRNKVGNAAFHVFDLRAELHWHIDGNAVSVFATKDWGTRGLTQSQILDEEGARIADLNKKQILSLHTEILKNNEGEIDHSIPVEFKFLRAQSVADAVAEIPGATYQRLFVVDHLTPSEPEVAAFCEWFKNRDPSVWTHFYCAGGKGRTTTFMAMADILENGKTDSLETILKRQHELGGANLADTSSSKPWMPPLKEKRFEFLKNFYNMYKN